MVDLSSPRDRLAVPLDVGSLADADALAHRVGAACGWLKVGFELFVAAGPAAVEVAAKQARVFLDLKLHDIPNTVARAVASATRLGAGLLTLHATGGEAMLRAAAAAAAESAAALGRPRLGLLGVTVLTSLGDSDLARAGVAGGVAAQAARLVDLARECGLDGVVASAREAAAIRARVGRDFLVVTPGIRPASAPADDQARTATPAEAIRAGADLLVVGRPISRASDPAGAARAVVAEIERALASDA